MDEVVDLTVDEDDSEDGEFWIEPSPAATYRTAATNEVLNGFTGSTADAAVGVMHAHARASGDHSSSAGGGGGTDTTAQSTRRSGVDAWMRSGVAHAPEYRPPVAPVSEWTRARAAHSDMDVHRFLNPQRRDPERQPNPRPPAELRRMIIPRVDYVDIPQPPIVHPHAAHYDLPAHHMREYEAVYMVAAGDVRAHSGLSSHEESDLADNLMPAARRLVARGGDFVWNRGQPGEYVGLYRGPEPLRERGPPSPGHSREHRRPRRTKS